MLFKSPIVKILMEMSTLAFRASSDLGLQFCFQFFRSVDLNKVTKKCLNALTLKLSYTWAWSLLIYLFLNQPFFRPIFVQYCVSRSRKAFNKNRQIEVFLYLSRCDFFEIEVFYSIFEHTSKYFFIFVSSFSFNVSLVHFHS